MKVLYLTEKQSRAEYCFKERTLEITISGQRRKVHNIWIKEEYGGTIFYKVDTEKNKVEPFFEIQKDDKFVPTEDIFFINTPIGWIEIK